LRLDVSWWEGGRRWVLSKSINLLDCETNNNLKMVEWIEICNRHEPFVACKTAS
jgi:hypothetical protein